MANELIELLRTAAEACRYLVDDVAREAPGAEGDRAYEDFVMAAEDRARALLEGA